MMSGDQHPREPVRQRAKSFVLLHGSWHGGWCWQTVAAALRKRGAQCWTPTLSGCAERAHFAAGDVGPETHVRDLEDLFFFEDLQDVILVGHSYAGLVVQGAVNALADRLAGLVFLDAYLAVPGGSALDGLPHGMADPLRAGLEAGVQFRPPPDPRLLGIDADGLAEWVAARLTPHPLAAYALPVPLENSNAAALPRAFLHCTLGDCAPIFATMAARAGSWGWPVYHLAAPHDVMLTHPQMLSRQLAALASEFLQRQRSTSK